MLIYISKKQRTKKKLSIHKQTGTIIHIHSCYCGVYGQQKYVYHKDDGILMHLHVIVPRRWCQWHHMMVIYKK